MAEDTQPAAERLTDALQLAAQALDLLDKAVGRAARLPVRDRERLREHLMPARNHLRSSVDSLRQKLEGESARRGTPRAR